MEEEEEEEEEGKGEKAAKPVNLFQRCSVLIQRFNAVLLHDSVLDCDCTDC